MARARGGKNLMELLLPLRSLGAGSHVTRKCFLKYPGTHWDLKDVRLHDLGAATGDAFGRFQFRGWERTNVRRVRSARKREWVLLYNAETNEYVWPHALESQPEDVRKQWEQLYFQGRAVKWAKATAPTPAHFAEAVAAGRIPTKTTAPAAANSPTAAPPAAAAAAAAAAER